ncbi:amidohydrolase family protein [Marivirga harenae]|uniref:amidohydrolase family protein n=1 Tax=Marivirga harenae TaxID=2010992 RepID=UPI0026DF14DA|nr:amidohydrolase family protein [Marivirga harenae]WKV11563.1 amidohydrolase family protein [Marivirga harenae]|tara:strand:- start:52521 stop:55547 length:3027 start_codon:yes stop_codon:yes gene_type:complete
MMKKILLVCLSFWFFSANAQETYTVNGVKDERPGLHAFINATVHLDYQTVIENASLVIQKGEVIGVGKDVSIPNGAIIHDLKGKHIYPSFIELSSNIGMPKAENGRSPGPQLGPKKEGAYNANDAIKSYFNAHEAFEYKDTDAEKMRKAGFGVVLTHNQDGLVRGTGSVIALHDGPENEIILKEAASNHFSFDKGSSTQDNPSSLMGAIALIKQTYLDAKWYANQTEMLDISLNAFNQNNRYPQFFDAGGDKLYVLRADRLGDEFGVQYIIKGNGDEYQRLGEIKSTNAQLILPVNYPEAYDVEDPFDAMNVSLEDMKHWEMAPYNLKMLSDKGINYSITSDGLKDASKLSSMISQSIEAGLAEEQALKALTFNPAQFVKMGDKLGSLSKGKYANFIITDGSPVKKETKIYENWVKGNPYKYQDYSLPELAGKYTLTVGNDEYQLEVKGDPGKEKFGIVVNDSTTYDVKSEISKQLITLSFKDEGKDEVGKIRLTGWLNDDGLSGNAKMPDGSWVQWTATLNDEVSIEDSKDEKMDEEKEMEKDELGPLVYPFVAHGNADKPKSETILIKNATVWTNEADGVLENTDVLLENGKIAKIGKGLTTSGAREIDGTGKHLTPGIIDEHSHIAISRGVNEGSEAVTAEVNIEDVVDSEDINIYRQLSGGVVASQLLHGSANPIGGRSAIIKLKWGYSPEEMKISWADKFIKFALGENVKQSNWGDRNTVRFPQTRMGVEQVFEDAFTRARAYEAEWKAYNSLSKRDKNNATPPRKDLELETLVEILNSERFISCHSYVQSEINMLMNVAERYGFRINTFTHILEGYKLADKMKEHGVGGSTFSDWWAYKFEVNDAIPYNAALMHGEGVVTAINSDDAEMGRRLNQEAGKTMKYGGVPVEEALKMVTLNPAKLLHLDDRMGSIKVGKDADVVLWSDEPLSIYAKAEKTIIEGAVFFDRDAQEVKLNAIQAERARLVAKMQGEKSNGKSTQKAKKKSQIIYHCETEIQNYTSLK